MKPVFILFNGYGTSKILWEYKLVSHNKIEKINFIKKLQEIGDVYTFNYKFFNFNYYYKGTSKEEKKINKLLNKKYDMYSKDIYFKIEDLDFKNICSQVYQDVIIKHGMGRKYIVVGHSFGCYIGSLFSKLFKNDCILNICIDNAPFIERVIKEQINSEEGKKEKTIVRKYFKTNKELTDILTKVTKSSDPNKYIKLLFDLIGYYAEQNKLKYFSNKMSVNTVFFKVFTTDPKTKAQKDWNRWLLQEKEQNQKNNTKFIIFLDADHYVWNDKNYCDGIVEEIINQLRKFFS